MSYPAIKDATVQNTNAILSEINTNIGTLITNSGGVPPGGGTPSTVTIQGGNTLAVKVDGSGVTQPISGTVTVTGTVNSPLTTPIIGQVKIVATNTIVPVSVVSKPLVNGIMLKASPNNNNVIFVGLSTATMTNDGTGNSYAMVAGDVIPVSASDLNQLYIIGTAGDFIYYIGN